MSSGSHQANTAVSLNRALYQRFSRLSLPRHTSYPSVPFWTKGVDPSVYSNKLRDMAQSHRPVSFYMHVPFCEKLCHYCGCNKLVISRENSEAGSFAQRYIAGIEQELAWVNAQAGDTLWNVRQIHLGGGTPTWLGLEDLKAVWGVLTKYMNIASDAEISIEIDPRVTSYDHLRLLQDLGFNRVSLGVQDFDPIVQQAIQRIQPVDMVERFVDECRRVGFSSVNFDLIYGLPMQTRESMDQTLAQVARMAPDRIAFYRLALLPDIFKWQRTFKEADIPGDELVLDFMLRAIEYFGEHGWDFIGLDHFAKKTDELSIAYRSGTLRRSFQGMTTGAELPVIAVGPSAISCLGDLFTQNEPQFPAWTKRVAATGEAMIKGHLCTPDDMIRQWALGRLYCYREINKQEFEREFGLGFDQYFSRARVSWLELAELGLIENSASLFRVRPMTGWLLLRVVAATLDGYLHPDAWREGAQGQRGSRVG